MDTGMRIVARELAQVVGDVKIECQLPFPWGAYVLAIRPKPLEGGCQFQRYGVLIPFQEDKDLVPSLRQLGDSGWLGVFIVNQDVGGDHRKGGA